MSRALPFFHAFTGCDTTFQFYGKGKRMAWKSWKSFPEVTEAFLSVMNQPFQFLKVDSTAIKLLERFTCILYDKTTPLVSVNELRHELFCKRKYDGDHTSYSGNQYFLNLSIIYIFYLHLHYILSLLFFNIRIGQFIRQVSGLEVCKKFKIFHYQKDLVGRTLRDLGSLFGPIYLRWRKQAES